MAPAPRLSMISASMNATCTELQAEYAIASRSGDDGRAQGIQAKLSHLADLHRQILGRPIEVHIRKNCRTRVPTRTKFCGQTSQPAINLI